MQWALLSVTNKQGVDQLARHLIAQGLAILATGGTASYLEGKSIPVTRVETLTGFETLLAGRVKTLHPVLYAGILSQETDADVRDRTAVGAPEIAVVAVDLYAFEEALAAQAPLSELVEAIDIGGVALVRAAAKNFERVLVLTRPEQYAAVLEQPLASWTVDERRAWAVDALRYVAYYDAMIADALGEQSQAGEFGPYWVIAGRRFDTLRYGENPHQTAGWYRWPVNDGFGRAHLLNGKALSYNNVLDAEAAWRLVRDLPPNSVVAVKHQIPCGVGVAATPAESYALCYAADPVSIYGGIVAVHGRVDEALARSLRNTFLEVVIGLEFTPEAMAVLGQKKNLRLLAMPLTGQRPFDLRMVAGGFVVQRTDRLERTLDQFRQVAGPVEPLGPALRRDTEIAWKTVSHVRSNAIVVVKDGASAGIGGGETNRIDAARHALERAGSRARGAVMASDGYFPFGDVVAEAAQYGIAVIVEPGGSRRDGESIEAAEKAGIQLWFTAERHFTH